MVCDLLCLLGEILFLLCIRQSPNAPSGLQWALIHPCMLTQTLLVGSGLSSRCCGDVFAGTATLLRQDNSRNGRGHQQEQHDRGNPMPNFHSETLIATPDSFRRDVACYVFLTMRPAQSSRWTRRQTTVTRNAVSRRPPHVG